MTQTMELFLGNDDRVLQGRLAGFLRRQYPVLGAPDLLARDIGCDARAARNYLAETWPGARQWRAIVRRWGRDVLTAVFDPEIDAARARLAAEIRIMEDDLAARRAALRALDGRSGGVAKAEDRKG